MLKVIALGIFLCFNITALAKNSTSAPFTSSELIDFTAKGDQKLLDFAKTDDFSGVVTRNHEVGDKKLVDVYEFKNIEAVPMNEAVCKKMLTRIFGDLDKISLKVSHIDIYTSHTGKTCDVQIDDADKEAKIPERRVIAGFLNAKPLALVFRLSKKSNNSDQESIHKFWDTPR